VADFWEGNGLRVVDQGIRQPTEERRSGCMRLGCAARLVRDLLGLFFSPSRPWHLVEFVAFGMLPKPCALALNDLLQMCRPRPLRCSESGGECRENPIRIA
jgi:hypothetical protein